MERKPDEWVVRLTDSGQAQSSALVELGEILRLRLAKAFRGNSKVDAAFIDDAVQDSLTGILRSIHQFENRSQFLTWATTLAVRTVVREMRRVRWKDVSLDQMTTNHPQTADSSISNADNPEVKAQSAQMIEVMYQIINTELSEKQKTFLLAYLNGMPQAEIGRRMGSSRNAIYKLGFDARTRLKEGLVKAGYSAEDLGLFEVAK